MAQIWWEPNPADIGGPPSDLVLQQVLRTEQSLEVSYNPLYSDPLALRLKIDMAGERTWGYAITEIAGIDVSNISGDISIYWDFKIAGSGSDGHFMCLVDPTSEKASAITLVSSRNGGDFALAVRSFTNGVRGTVTGTSTGLTKNFVRRYGEMQKVGNAYYAKVWEEGGTEPVDWLTSNESFAHPNASGCFGIMRHRNPTTTIDYSLDIFGFGIGTNGDPAPRGPVEPPTERKRSKLIITPW